MPASGDSARAARSFGICEKKNPQLANTRARLHGLYGDEQSFTLSNAPGGGLIVTVSLPFRGDGMPDDEDIAAELARPPVTPHPV